MKTLLSALKWCIVTVGAPFVAVVLLMISVVIVIGPLFGIAVLIDNYGEWWVIAFIPYIMLLPILGKPLESFYP